MESELNLQNILEHLENLLKVAPDYPNMKGAIYTLQKEIDAVQYLMNHEIIYEIPEIVQIREEIEELKKDINNVLGDLIEAVYLIEATSDKQDSKEGSEIIDNAIATFDELIAKVNEKGVKNSRQHLKNVRNELEEKATALSEKINKL